MSAAATIAPPWVVTASGRCVSLSAPTPDQISIDDIALHLSRLPRFLGATRAAYSVAQHSCLVADILHRTLPNSPQLELAGLLHDAHEAFIGDIVTPVGWALGVERLRGGRDADGGAGGDPALDRLKRRMDRAIGASLGLAPASEADRDLIKQADRQAFRAEWRELMPGPCPGKPMADEWRGKIEPLAAGAAAVEFRCRFHRLKAAVAEKAAEA
jgi:hypothetical protein